MCGIVGYVGPDPACGLLVDGLKRLEYRGYDSAGIAVLHNGTAEICKTQGKIGSLENLLSSTAMPVGHAGIGHTRWATHGKPSTENAHPHKAGRAIVVHNGIIENYSEVKSKLIAEGSVFSSDTDTEVIAHLIDRNLRQGATPLQAVQNACKVLVGSFAAGILIEGDTDTLYAVRKESPLIVGLGEQQAFIASDVPALLQHTRRMVFMDDGEIAILRAGEVAFMDFDGKPLEKVVQEIALDPVLAVKGGYKHFMLKEIFEQPDGVANTCRGRIVPETGEVKFDGLRLTDAQLRNLEKIVIVACGTSYHAGLVARRIIEDLTRIPVEVDIASEFRYRNPIIGPHTLLVSISQSGETADTLAASREALRRGAKMIAICNVIESSLARLAQHGVIYTQAGPEIGVASTKAFTTQLTILYALAVHLASKRNSVSRETRRRLISDLLSLPAMMEQTLALSDQISQVAAQFKDYGSFLFLGRGVNTPIAYEGALKLKEISYIHAEAYAGGEMKHGPIALISPEMPVVVLLSHDSVYEKMLGNMEEVRSRGGTIIVVVAGEPEERIRKLAHSLIAVPETNEYLGTILLTIPLQLFAYHVADLRGNDVDRPRNLAKSVTVE